MSRIRPTRRRRSPRWLLRVAATVGALLLLAGACADSVDDDSGETSADPMAFDGDGSVDDGGSIDDGDGDRAVTEPADADRPTAGDDRADTDGEEGATDPTDDGPARAPGGPIGVEDPIPPEITGLFVGRDIIFTATVDLEVDDVAEASVEVVDAVQAAGGAIWGQDTRTGTDPQSVLTVRVAPVDFGRVLAALEGVGTLVSQVVTTDDVTERVIDLESRITAAESSAARVRALLDAANDLPTIFQLEEELVAREALLESLRGQLQTVEDQVALATITVTITQANPLRLDAEMEVVSWLGTDVDDACPGTADLSIGADDSATLCVNISNTGEDVLTDLDVASPTFRLRVDDFTPVGDGTVAELAPGDELLLAVELAADGGFIRRTDASAGIPIEVTVTATPASTPDAELVGGDAVFLSADVDDPLPGFGDSFQRGWSALVAVVSVLMIVLGVLLPFAPFIAVAVWLAIRAHRAGRDRAYGPEPATPPA